MEFYKKWVSEIPFQKEEHPWAQFRDKTDKTEGETQESNVT